MSMPGELAEPWELDAEAGGFDANEYLERFLRDNQGPPQPVFPERQVTTAKPLTPGELAAREFIDIHWSDMAFGD